MPLSHRRSPRQRRTRNRSRAGMPDGGRSFLCPGCGGNGTTDAVFAKIRRVELVAEPSARERTERRSHEHFSCASEKNVRCRHARRCDARSGAHVPFAGAPALSCRGMSRREGASSLHRQAGARGRNRGAAPRSARCPSGAPDRPGGAPSIQPERGGPVRGSPRILGPDRGRRNAQLRRIGGRSHFCSGPTRDVCYYPAPPFSRSPVLRSGPFLGRMRTLE